MAWALILDAPSYEVVYGQNFNISGRIENDHGGSVANMPIWVGYTMVDFGAYITVNTDASGRFIATVVTAGWAKKLFDPTNLPNWDFTPNCVGGAPAGQYYAPKNFTVKFCDPNPNVLTGRCAESKPVVKVWKEPCKDNCPPPPSKFLFTAAAVYRDEEYRNGIYMVAAFEASSYGVRENGCYPYLYGPQGNTMVSVTIRRPDTSTPVQLTLGPGSSSSYEYSPSRGMEHLPAGTYTITFRYAGDATVGYPAQTDTHTVVVPEPPPFVCGHDDTQTTTCPEDGTTLVTATCHDNAWVPTNYQCGVPPPNCIEGLGYGTPKRCSSAPNTPIYPRLCQSNALVDNPLYAAECPSEPPTCDGKHTSGTCTGVGTGLKYVCIDGVWGEVYDPACDATVQTCSPLNGTRDSVTLCSDNYTYKLERCNGTYWELQDSCPVPTQTCDGTHRLNECTAPGSGLKWVCTDGSWSEVAESACNSATPTGLKIDPLLIVAAAGGILALVLLSRPSQ